MDESHRSENPLLFQQFVTTAQAAKALGVGPMQVARDVRKGRIRPAHKMPGRTGAYLFTPEEVRRAARTIRRRRKAGS